MKMFTLRLTPFHAKLHCLIFQVPYRSPPWPCPRVLQRKRVFTGHRWPVARYRRCAFRAVSRRYGYRVSHLLDQGGDESKRPDFGPSCVVFFLFLFFFFICIIFLFFLCIFFLLFFCIFFIAFAKDPSCLAATTRRVAWHTKTRIQIQPNF